jgi:hypothetical protein
MNTRWDDATADSSLELSYWQEAPETILRDIWP